MKTKITLIENLPTLPGEPSERKLIVYYVDLSDYQLIKYHRVNSFDGSLNLTVIELINRYTDAVIHLPIKMFVLPSELETIFNYYNSQYTAQHTKPINQNYWDAYNDDVNERN